MTVVTRFAPSPTGFLHIGGARTALFNFLFARHHGGKYLLRIEDTDRKRSTPEAIDAILDGLDWLGLGPDEPPLYQSTQAARHAAIARELLEQGHAYRCYCTPEELTLMRETARAEGRSVRYDGRWRDCDPADAPADVPPVIRFKAPNQGETVIADAVQGEVRVGNEQLDDMVLLRADGSPTYMLSVVVDDHDMGITHAIRGDDHLTNAFRQTQLFLALGWQPPTYAHIPLIHGPDGAKLSKRHGALGVQAYREMGYLPEALLNYLLRLGWSHGDEEIIPLQAAIGWFDLDAVGRGAARFDFDKLGATNAHYLRDSSNQRLADLARPGIETRLERPLDDADRTRLAPAMETLKTRAKTIVELVEKSLFYFATRPLTLEPKAAKALRPEARARLGRLAPALRALRDWRESSIEQTVRDFVDAEGGKLGDVAQPLRAALTGSNVSPGIFELCAVLGQDETLGRMSDVTAEI